MSPIVIYLNEKLLNRVSLSTILDLVEEQWF